MTEDTRCFFCFACVQPPYIECKVCLDVHLCLSCFSRGKEREQHENNHGYVVIKNDFVLFGEGWTAEEEVRLLGAIDEFGYGNWQDVAKQVRTHAAQQCEAHYNYFYITEAADPLPAMPESLITVHPAPVVYRSCEEPPRPADGTVWQNEMAGYMAGRGDFTTEYNNFAELELSDMEFSITDDPVEQEIKCAVVDIYQRRLDERQRRKKIMREHGLVDYKRTYAARRRAQRILGNTTADRLLGVAQLMAPVEFDKFFESLMLEAEAKEKIKKLQAQREEGLMLLSSGALYERLSARREDKQRQSLLSELVNSLTTGQNLEGVLVKAAHYDNPAVVEAPLPSRRSIAAPLEITALPGYEKLSTTERDLCSNIRIVPESYLEFRKILVAENDRMSGMRLQHARNLIKIDVNKTRKLFDFLVSEGTITKDMSKS